MNKHIELVKKWLADPESVSLEELEVNKEAAETAEAAADAAVRAATGGNWADWVTDWRDQAIKHVEAYEELTK